VLEWTGKIIKMKSYNTKGKGIIGVILRAVNNC